MTSIIRPILLSAGPVGALLSESIRLACRNTRHTIRVTIEAVEWRESFGLKLSVDRCTRALCTSIVAFLVNESKESNTFKVLSKYLTHTSPSAAGRTN